MVKQFEDHIANAPLVVLDGNVPLETITYVLDHCAACKVPVWYEPTDIQKATKPWVCDRGYLVSFTSPNLNELRSICSHQGLGDIASLPDNIEEIPKCLTQILRTASPLLDTMNALMVTMDKNGFMIIRKSFPSGRDNPLLPISGDCSAEQIVNGDSEEEKALGLYFRGEEDVTVVSVAGAGDCLASGFICGMLKGKSVSECSAVGLSAAAESLKTSPAVPETLTFDALPWGTKRPFTPIGF